MNNDKQIKNFNKEIRQIKFINIDENLKLI